ncbi:hypothetical protein [Henriciella sp.]|uniref:hypothetical protein n=1 Tax=Henriciella sp. TaxID=1968823 RepID=UPI002619DD85|nr:hypothetical protein [Henriciella sp.]
MKPLHFFSAVVSAAIFGNIASAEPDFGGFALWNNDDAGYVSSAEWTAECGGSEYRVSLSRSDQGKNTYSVTRDGKPISEEIDNFISRNTSYFQEYNWLESVYCGKVIDRSGPEDIPHYIVKLNFFGISRLPHYKYAKFDGVDYNAYKYSVTIEDTHISAQNRINLEDQIVSDLPEYLEEQHYDKAVPGTVLGLDYCKEGPPCPEFTGENAEKAD